MERKKLAEIIGSVFVALIFLSSYASFGGKIITPNATTTAQVPYTFRAEAKGVAAITSYGSVMNITIHCQNVSNVSTQIDSFINAQNKSVVAFPPYSYQASQIIVTAGQLGSYYLYNAISQNIGASANCTQFASSARILLPSTMSFLSQQSGSAIIQIPVSLRNSSQSVVFTSNMSNTMNVFVDAILTLNGTIYGGTIRVWKA